MGRALRVGVVGGGIAGLYTSYLLALKGFKVVLYEALPYIGRLHCTGIVSIDTMRRIEAAEHVEHYYDRLLVSYRGLRVLFYSRSSFACRIDRVGHERSLAEQLLGLGAKLYTSTRVVGVKTSSAGGQPLVISSRGRLVVDYALIADGSLGAISKSLGFNPAKQLLYGYQLLLSSDKRLPEEYQGMMIVVYDFDERGGFLWIAPVSGRSLLVGYASTQRFNDLLLLSVRNIIKDVMGVSTKPYKFFGGVLVRGYPRQLVLHRKILCVGDANSMTKAISCGGLYHISLAGRGVVEYLCLNSMKTLSSVKRSVKNGYLLYNALKMLTRARMLMRVKPVLHVKIGPREYDEHPKILLNLLRRGV